MSARLPTVVAVVPVKRFAAAKSRLAGCLDDPTRIELARAMAGDVLAAAAAAPSIDLTLVVGNDAGIGRFATDFGAASLLQTDDGLDAAIGEAVAEARRRGARTVVVVPADLPLLSAGVLERLVATSAGGRVVVAPAGRDGGTNGLVLPAALPFRFSYGVDSAARHLAEARRLGQDPIRVALDELAIDVDRPEDLAALGVGRAGPRTSAVLRRIAAASAVLPHAVRPYLPASSRPTAVAQLEGSEIR